MTRYPNSIPPNPRTLAEAFGPYTDHALHPMPETSRQHPASWAILAIGICVVAAMAAERLGWINFTGA